MSTDKFNPRTIILLLYILVIVAVRVVAPLSDEFSKIANFTMVGAVALFGGAYFNNNFKAFGFPLVTLLLSDILLNVFIYKGDGLLYGGWYWTYIAFAMMVLAGKVIMKNATVTTFLGGSLATVFIHWLVTDLGVFIGSTLYPQTLAGFWACLAFAIPFELNFLYGTLMYGAVMFGSFEFLKSKYPALRFQKV